MTTKNGDLTYTEDNVNLFIRRFSTGKWATQGALDIGKGQTPYYPASAEGPFTPDLVRQHLDTKITLGSYVITNSNTCRFIVIDFDIDSSVAKDALMQRTRASEKAKSDALAQMVERAKSVIEGIVSTLKIDRNQILIEKSGSKGFHVWMFFEDEVPALSTYKMRNVLIDEFGLSDVEIFPKQSSASKGSPGSLIKLPLGINRKTMERCLFLNSNFDPDLNGVWSALEKVVPVTRAQLDNIIKLQDTAVNMAEDDADCDDLTVMGASIETMIAECSALKGISERALREESPEFSHDERVCMASLFNKFGMIGKSKIHEFLRNSDNYDAEKTDQSFDGCKGLKPMRCSTMQERGICPGTCDNIEACSGVSPIKLALKNIKSKGKENICVINSLSEIENPVICYRNVRVDFTVCSLVGGPYYSTKKVKFEPCSELSCSKFEECPSPEKYNEKEVEIPDYDKFHILVYGADDGKVSTMLKKRIGCSKPGELRQCDEREMKTVQPFTCSNIVYSLGESMAKKMMDKRKGIEEDTSADSGNAAKEMKDYLAFYLGSRLETSKSYRGYGKIMPNPQNQSLTLLFDKVEPLNSQIDNFTINDSNKDLFEQFKKIPLEEKIVDLEDNILFYYGRRNAVMALMFTYFSILDFEFNKTPLSHGWVETLLIGDSGQMKSLMVERFAAYTGLGIIGGSAASVAGLVGGVEKIQTKQYISWGLFPRANKSLVMLDEIQTMSPEIITNIRQIRQQGFASITKIVKGTHEAKVRLICAANPKASRNMSSFKYGASAITGVLVPADIRRFDLAVVLNANDSSPALYNKVNKGENPTMTPEMLKTAILWAWSRKSSDVEISLEVTERILKNAGELGEKFGVDTVPLCNPADMREKLARLTAAIAAFNGRTPDNVKLVPTLEDVDIATCYLIESYSHKSFGLDMLAIDKRNHDELSVEQAEELIELGKKPEYKLLNSVIGCIAGLDEFQKVLVASHTGATEGDDISRILMLLIKHGMIAAHLGDRYKVLPKCLKFYRSLEEGAVGDEEVF